MNQRPPPDTRVRALVQVPHDIIVSTRPDLLITLRNTTRTLNLTHVHFSGPFMKTKWGVDYLRGHIANLKYAVRYTNMTHGVWATSSNMCAPRSRA